MVGSGETPFAHFAPERFVTGMLAIMPGQLVRPRETPFTRRPRAPVWFFAYTTTTTITKKLRYLYDKLIKNN